MILFDMLNLNREFLSRLRDAGAHLDDIDYLDLFAEFNSMVQSGLKTSYAVSALSERFGVSVRSVYSIIARLRKPLQP